MPRKLYRGFILSLGRSNFQTSEVSRRLPKSQPWLKDESKQKAARTIRFEPEGWRLGSTVATVLLQEIQLARPRDALRAALDVQLAKDVVEVLLDGPRGEHQFVPDFLI